MMMKSATGGGKIVKLCPKKRWLGRRREEEFYEFLGSAVVPQEEGFVLGPAAI